MSGYREHAVAPRLAPFVECFWTLETTEDLPAYPVLPDGCVDIVCSRGRRWTEPQVVGTMTRAQVFALRAGQFDCGVRFRPGMSAAFFRIPGVATTDASIPVSEVWGARGRQLAQQFPDARSPEQCVALLEAQLVNPSVPGVVQRVAAFIVGQSGQVRVDDLAFDAGMSARQVRRIFMEEIGLSPKHFCRVIRFRHSLTQLARSPRGDWAQVALDCGYYDQAHFINEFRELSGFSPSEFVSRAR
ncbi:MAG TPA: AraC family transcriptional regulator [Bryobacteraceae bacterium]|nr:AraC family transcriptional regulator [Bryobacteraceae bacterium]